MHAGRFYGARRIQFFDNLIFKPEIFTRLFCHWCPEVRRVFHYVLIYRLVRDENGVRTLPEWIRAERAKRAQLKRNSMTTSKKEEIMVPSPTPSPSTSPLPSPRKGGSRRNSNELPDSDNPPTSSSSVSPTSSVTPPSTPSPSNPTGRKGFFSKLFGKNNSHSSSTSASTLHLPSPTTSPAATTTHPIDPYLTPGDILETGDPAFDACVPARTLLTPEEVNLDTIYSEKLIQYLQTLKEDIGRVKPPKPQRPPSDLSTVEASSSDLLDFDTITKTRANTGVNMGTFPGNVSELLPWDGTTTMSSEPEQKKPSPPSNRSGATTPTSTSSSSHHRTKSSIKIPRYPNLVFPVSVRVYGQRALAEFDSYVAAYRRVQKAFRHSPNFRKTVPYPDTQAGGPIDLIQRLRNIENEIEQSKKAGGVGGKPNSSFPTSSSASKISNLKVEFKRAHVFLPLLYFEITAPKHTLSIYGGSEGGTA